MVAPAGSGYNNPVYQSSVEPLEAAKANKSKEEAEGSVDVDKRPRFSLKGLALVGSLPSSPEFDLLGYLFSGEVTNNEGDLLDKYKNRPLQSLNDEQAGNIQDLLMEPFEVKGIDGKVIKEVSIGSLVCRFLENLPEEYEVTEINLIGGYLVYLLLHKHPEYREELFSDLPFEVQGRLRNYFANKSVSEPNDIDIRIKIRHKNHTPYEIQVAELEEVLYFFLKDLGSSRTIAFQKLGRADFGLNKFRIVLFEGCKKEISLCMLSQRDYLFSIDEYYLPLKEMFFKEKVALTPQSYTKNGRQGLLDASLGILRTKDVDSIDISGFFREISRMTKGDSAGRQGMTEKFAKSALSINAVSKYLEKIEKCLDSHHSYDPLEVFSYLFNFTYFLSLPRKITKKLWTQFYNAHKKPDGGWAAQVIDQVTRQKIPFSKIVATLNTGFYISAAKGAPSGVVVDADHFEFKRDVFKVRLGASTLQLLYDPELEMGSEEEQLTLLQSVIAGGEGTEGRFCDVQPHERPSGLGLFSCFLKKDLAESFEALLTQVKGSDNQSEIDLAADIAMFLLSEKTLKRTKDNSSISEALVFLVTSASDKDKAQQLMTLGTRKGFIRKGSHERTIGWLHFLRKYYEKNRNFTNVRKRYKRLRKASEIILVPEVEQLFADMLSDTASRRPFTQTAFYLKRAPMSDNFRQKCWAGIIKQYLEQDDLSEAIAAFNEFVQFYPGFGKKEEPLEELIGFLEHMPNPASTDFVEVAGVLGSARGLSSEKECKLLARFIASSVSLKPKQNWKLDTALLERFLDRVLEVDIDYSSSLVEVISVIIADIRKFSSQYGGVQAKMKDALPKFLSHAKGADSIPYYRFFQEIRATYFPFAWSEKDRGKVSGIWCKIEKEAVKQKDIIRIKECFQELNADDAVELFSEAVDLIMKQGKVEDAIEFLEGVYSLDETSLDKVWIKYTDCLKKLQGLSKRAERLMKSPIVPKVNFSAKNIVEECAKGLLASSSRSKKSVSIALALFLKYSYLFGLGDGPLLLTLLKAVSDYHPQKLLTTVHEMELIVDDSEVKKKAWALALPTLLKEKSDVVLQFVTGEKLLPPLPEATKKEIASVALEICSRKSPKQRGPVLEALLVKKDLNFEGKMMLISDCVLHGRQEKVFYGSLIMMDHYMNRKFLLEKYFASHGYDLEVEMIIRLVSSETPPLSHIFSLLRFVNFNKVMEIDFLPVLEWWSETEPSTEISDGDLLVVSRIIVQNLARYNFNSKEELEERLTKVVSAGMLLNKFAAGRGDLQKNVEFLRNVVAAYNVLGSLEITAKSVNDDLLWKCLYCAFELGRFEYTEVMDRFYPCAMEMLKRRGRIDGPQEKVIEGIRCFFSFWLPISQQPKVLLIFLNDLFDLCKNPLNQENGRPNSLFLRQCSEYIYKACGNTSSSMKMLLESCIIVLGKYLIPNFYFRQGEIVDLIEACFRKGVEISKNKETVREHERGYYESYKQLFDQCLLDKKPFPLFEAICRKLCSEPHNVAEYAGSDYVRSLSIDVRSIKREIRTELFRYLLDKHLMDRRIEIARNTETFCRCMRILIYYCKNIIADGWYLEDPLIVIEMMKEVIPELYKYFSINGYDKELDLYLDMADFAVNIVPKYLSSFDPDDNRPKILRFPKRLLCAQGKEFCKPKEFQNFFYIEACNVLCQWRERLESHPGDRMAGGIELVNERISYINSAINTIG